MDTVKFIEERNRMCKSFNGCDKCLALPPRVLDAGGGVMERLTKRATDGQAIMDCEKCKADWTGKHGKSMVDCTPLYCRNRLKDRLAAYEDTGLQPESVEALKLSMMGKAISEIKEFDGLPIDRLRELAEADKDGRLVVLPCKDWLEVVFGDQVLFWGIDKDYIEQPIREISLDDAERVGWYDGYKTVFLKGTDENGEAWEFYPEEIGKTVFLTREEAEKALEALKDE